MSFIFVLFWVTGWAEIIFCVAGSRSFFDIFQVFALFSPFVLLIDDLTETFATGANSSYADTPLFGPFLQTHSRSWKDYNKKPSYLHRYRVKHSVFTSNLFEMQIVHQIEHPSTTPNLFSTPFLLKIPSCNFRPNQPSLTSALSLQVVPSSYDTPLYCFYLPKPFQGLAPFMYRYISFIHPEFSHVPFPGSSPSTVTFQKKEIVTEPTAE